MNGGKTVDFIWTDIKRDERLKRLAKRNKVFRENRKDSGKDEVSDLLPSRLRKATVKP